MPIELKIHFPNADQVSVKFDDDETEVLAFQSPFNEKLFAELAWYLETYAASYIADVDIKRANNIAQQLKILGRDLFQSVLSNAQAKRLFDRFQDSHEKRLLTITANDTHVLSLPWELLCEPNGTFLMNDVLSIRRRFLGKGTGRTPFKVSSKESLRVLFVISRPSNASFLNPRSEAKAVMQALENNTAIELEFLRPATLNNLIQRLENHSLPAIDIVHFDGHGAFHVGEVKDISAKQEDSLSKQSAPDKNIGYLLFENQDGKKDYVSAEQLADALYRKKIALILLSACQSAMVGGEDALNSVAARLTHAGLPSVLAMTYSVLISTTEKLFKEFYAALLQGKHIGEALDQTRRHLSFNPQRGERQCGGERITLELQDWFVPALYQASSDYALLTTASPLKDWQSFEPNNLPKLQDAGFFGRSKELWFIERAFVQNVRSVAITGFGGQGKTYLAIEAGLWLQQTGLFERVCFVDYAAFQGSDAVSMAVTTLATVLNIDAHSVTSELKRTACLLILDNLEALSPAAQNELLTAAATWREQGQSRVIITTRQAQFNHAAFPSEHSTRHRYLPLQGLSKEDAIAYFQTLQKLPPKPKVAPPKREALFTLFEQVAYHPLSIALLARELKFRRPADLGQRLEALLAAIPADNQEKSLLASLRLSLDRLSPEARQLLPRLGVFQGGAMEDMLLKVTGLGKVEEEEAQEIQLARMLLQLFESGELPEELKEKSQELEQLKQLLAELPQQELAEGVNEETWQALKQSLISTGLIQVEDLSHLGIVVPFLKFHPTLAPALWQELSAEQQQTLNAAYRLRYYQFSRYLYSEDSKNPHAARAIAQRELPNLIHAVKVALKTNEAFAVDFVDKVNRFLKLFGLNRDAAELVKAAEQLSGDIGSDNWYTLQTQQGEVLYQSGHYAAAAQVFQTLVEQLGQTPSYRLCVTLNNLGRCLNQQGNTAPAIASYQHALAAAEQLETSKQVQSQIGLLHTDLANAFRDDGQFSEAKARYQQALAIVEELDDTRSIAAIQGQLGTLAMYQGDLPEAEQRYQAALAMFQSLHEPQSEAILWHQLGRLYQTAEIWQAAEQAYRESARLKEALGDTQGAAVTWNNLALVAEAQAQWQVAESWYRKAIAVHQQGTPKNLAMSLHNLADLLQSQQPPRLSEARACAEQALNIKKNLDTASTEIWTTYNILANIAEQQSDPQAADYRRKERDSYLQFAGMLYQMRQHAWLIDKTILAVSSRPRGLLNQARALFGKTAVSQEVLQLQAVLAKAPDDWQNFTQAINAILKGERNETRLLEPLDYTEAAIIHLILQGIANPDSLATLFND